MHCKELKNLVILVQTMDNQPEISLSSNKREKGKRIVWVALILLFFFLYALWSFYLPITGSFFIGDDISWIFFSATKSPLKIFFSPIEYRAISGSNYTPFLGLSFKVDWMLFGMESKGYFIHNLIAVVLTSIAFFLLLHLYVDNFMALKGSILFLFNPILLSVFSMSSARHYIEGMFFALISLWLFIRADRANKISILSGFFFLLSSLCKEVYVIVPFVAFVLSKGSLLDRFKRTLPLWCISLLYTALRLSIFEGNIGGYFFSKELGMQMIANGLYRFFKYTPSLLLGPYGLFLVILIFAFVLLGKKGKGLITASVLFVILLIPVLPVLWLLDSSFFWSRYIFHLSIFCIVSLILWGNMVIKRGKWYRIMFFFVLCIVVGGFLMRDYELRTLIMTERDALKRAYYEFAFSGKRYIQSSAEPWFYDGLRDINEYLYRKKIDTKVIPEPGLMKYISEERLKNILSEDYLLKRDSAIDLKRGIIKGLISIEGYQIKWELGPYKVGRYHILRGRYSGLYNYINEVVSKGMYKFGKYYPDGRPDVFYMRAVYQSPEGWEGITEEYRVEVPGNYLIRF